MKKTKVAKFLSLLVVLPAGLVLVTFAVVNRHAAAIDFWPLPFKVDAPLSVVLMIALVAGVIWGGAASWLASGVTRRRGREAARRAEQSDDEARRLKERVARLEAQIRDAKATNVIDADDPAAGATKALPPANAA